MLASSCLECPLDVRVLPLVPPPPPSPSASPTPYAGIVLPQCLECPLDLPELPVVPLKVRGGPLHHGLGVKQPRPQERKVGLVACGKEKGGRGRKQWREESRRGKELHLYKYNSHLPDIKCGSVAGHLSGAAASSSAAPRRTKASGRSGTTATPRPPSDTTAPPAIAAAPPGNAAAGGCCTAAGRCTAVTPGRASVQLLTRGRGRRRGRRGLPTPAL